MVRKLSHTIPVALIMMMTASTLCAQQAELTLEKGFIQLGEQVGLYVTFTLPGGWPSGEPPAEFWPVKGDTLTSQVEIVDRYDLEYLASGSELIIKQELIITSFDTGYVVIAPLIFIVDGREIESNALLLQVLTPELDAEGPRDIKQLRDVTYTWFDRLMEHIWAIIAGLLALALTLMGWRYLQKRTSAKATPAAEAAHRLPAHLEALEALAELEKATMWQKGEPKRYHTELTDILRHYVGRRYKVSTLERTSRELIADLRMTGLPLDELNRLKATLELADMVKFAKYTPLAAENERALLNAYDFVNATAEIEQPNE